MSTSYALLNITKDKLESEQFDLEEAKEGLIKISKPANNRHAGRKRVFLAKMLAEHQTILIHIMKNHQYF